MHFDRFYHIDTYSGYVMACISVVAHVRSRKSKSRKRVAEEAAEEEDDVCPRVITRRRLLNSLLQCFVALS